MKTYTKTRFYSGLAVLLAGVGMAVYMYNWGAPQSWLSFMPAFCVFLVGFNILVRGTALQTGSHIDHVEMMRDLNEKIILDHGIGPNRMGSVFNHADRKG